MGNRLAGNIQHLSRCLIQSGPPVLEQYRYHSDGIVQVVSCIVIAITCSFMLRARCGVLLNTELEIRATRYVMGYNCRICC